MPALRVQIPQVAHNVSMIKKLLRKRRGKEKDVLRELVPYRTMDASLKEKFSSIVAETGFWKDGNHVRDAYADYLAHEWAHFPPIKAHVRLLGSQTVARTRRVVASFWQNFGKMLFVLGCIGTDFCKKICVLQHFSKSTRFHPISS